MVCCTPSAHTGVRSIFDFLWSGVKLPIWLLALLLTITCAANVQMAHARPLSTSILWDLSNSIKNTSRQGVFPSAIEFWSCWSLGGLQVPTFGSVSLILTVAPKCVATLLWVKCEDETPTPKVGDLESSGTPEHLKFDSRGQNTLHWGVLGVIGKVLKRRCPNDLALVIWTSAAQVMGKRRAGSQTSSLTPDH